MEIGKGKMFYTEDQAEIVAVLERLRADAERGTLKPGTFTFHYADGNMDVMVIRRDGKATMTSARPANDENSTVN